MEARDRGIVKVVDPLTKAGSVEGEAEVCLFVGEWRDFLEDVVGREVAEDSL